MQSQAPNEYTAADIARYHNGKMPVAEMHAMEKAALEDPFLADAMEGYANTKAAVKDVAALKQKVHKRSQNMRVVHRNRRLLYSLAALLILLAGFGWLSTRLANKNERDLAVQEKAAPSYTQPQDSQPESTARNASSQHGATSKAKKKTGTQAYSTKELQSPAAAPTDNATDTQRSDAGLQDSQTFLNAHTAAVPMAKTENAIAARRFTAVTVNGRVVNTQQQPIPNATVSDTMHAANSSTDTAGNFTLIAPDTTVTIAVTATGYVTRITSLKPADSGALIVLQPISEPPHKSIKVTNAVPREGWRNYQAYINQNLVLPAEGTFLTGAKEVRLSFDVDSAGNAAAITIEKSLCTSCDSIAVNVIREGTTWKKTKKKGKATARIIF
jgi:hypothetical protein